MKTGGDEQQHQADTDDESQWIQRNHAYAEKTKSSESKRTSRLVHNLKLTGRTRRRAKHRDENETNKAKIETKKDSEK